MVVEAPLGTGLVGQAAATGAVVVSEEGSMACVPVVNPCRAAGGAAAYAVLQCTRDEAAHGPQPFDNEDGHPTMVLLRSLAPQLAPVLAAGRQAKALRGARRYALSRVVGAATRRRTAEALVRWAAACGVGGGAGQDRPPAIAAGAGQDVVAAGLGVMEALAGSGQMYLLWGALEKAARELLEACGVAVGGVWANMQDLLPEAALALGPVGSAEEGGVEDVAFSLLHCSSGGGGDSDEEDGATESYAWEPVQAVLRVQLAGANATPLREPLRGLLQLLVRGAAGWLSGASLPRLVRRARELGLEGAVSRREAVQLRGEAIDLHDQVYRQQAELNALGQRLEAATARAHHGVAVLEAAERLLGAAWGWQSLRDALPAAASLVLLFDRLEYRFRAAATQLMAGGAGEGEEEEEEEEEGVMEVVDVASSSEARHSTVLAQVMAAGTPAISQLCSSSELASSPSPAPAPAPVASLCLPLFLGGAAAGALLLERRGGASFSEEDVAGATRLATLLAGVVRRLAREQVQEDRARRAGGPSGLRAGKLLAAAERLWASAGSVEEVYAAFEQGVAGLLLAPGEENGPPMVTTTAAVQCTLFLADAQHGLLRAANGETVPLGVGALGAAAASGRALWEGRHSLYVPVVVPDDGAVLAVARVRFARGGGGRGGAEHCQQQQPQPAEDGVGEEEQEEALRAVAALVRLLLPVLQHSQALTTAFGGMRDASDALESLSGRLAAAREEAAAEAAGRTRAEEVVAALQRLHVDCSRGPDSLVALFRAAETAACLATGADAAALLLVLDEEEGPKEGAASSPVGRPPELWTLWPTETGQGQERGRLHIQQETGPAEVHAVMQGSTVAISSTHAGPQLQQQGPGGVAFTPFQSWLFGHVEVEREGGQGGEGEGDGALLPESTVLMVPVLQLSGGVAGVLEVVKRGRLDGQEEGALVVLARALSTVLAWFQAQLQLSRARVDEAALRQVLVEQAKAAEALDVGARQAGVLANLAFDLLAAPDRRAALALAEAHLQEAMGAQAVRLQPQQPQQPSLPEHQDFADSAASATGGGGAEGLEVSLGVRKGRLECEVAGAGGRVLGMVVVDGPGMALEPGAELDEEEIQLLVARVWLMLERALGSVVWREATVSAAGGWERLSRRLLDMVGLAGRDWGGRSSRHNLALLPPPSPQALDPASPLMQAQAAALGPYVRVVEEASTDLLGADSARLFLVGRDRALALLLAATGLEVGPSTPPDPAAVGAAALELWVLAEGGEEPVSTAAPWYLEKQPPLQSRGPAMAAVWDHLRRWLPLLGLAEDRQGRLLPRGAATPGLGRENGEMEADPDLTMDIRWPHGAADARRGRQPPVMSVPIFLPAAPHQQPVALSDALVGVLVVERTLPLGDEPSARPFTPGDAELAAQWSLRLAGLLGGLVREGFFRSHALARQRQAKLGLLCRRLATARTRQAFQRWRRNARLDARDHATATQGQAAAARAAHARVLHLLAACVECVAGLGPVAAEEEDTEVLLGELEQLVWQRLPAALPAQRCTLTLLRPGEERKQLKAAGGGSSGSNGSNGGGGILLSKPVLTPSGDLAGLLEAAVDDAGAVAAIEEVDRALGLGAQLIGGLAALLRELGAAREKHGEAAHTAKVLESQARLYREAAEAAVRCEALATDAGAFLLHKSDLAAALLPAAHDLPALGRVVAETLPRLLAPAAAAASATLLLPSRLCSPSGRRDGGGVHFAPAYQAPSSSVGPHQALAALTEAKMPELLERCRVTRRRVVRILRQEEEAGGASVRLLCEPVVDAEDGTVWAVLRVVLPLNDAEEDGEEEAAASEADEARDRVLGWAAGVLATAVEGARRVEALREKAVLDHWLAVRYRRLAEFGRLLQARAKEAEQEGDHDEPSASLLAWVAEQAPAVLGAERAALFLRQGKGEGSLWAVKADGESPLSVSSAAAAKSAVGQLVRAASGGVPSAQRRVWGLPRTALLSYDAGVDVALGRSEVLGMAELEAASAGLPLLGALQAGWDPAKLPAGAVDAARPLAKEMARQVAAAVLVVRQHQQQHQRQPAQQPAASHGAAAQQQQQQQQQQQLGLQLARDLLPVLLAAPLREPRIQAVMRALTRHGERLLRSSLAARLGPSSSSSGSGSVALDFFALDQEGLWTLARPHEAAGAAGEERILTVPATATGIVAQAAREQRPLVRRFDGGAGEQEEGDLIGVGGDASAVVVAAFPVLSPAAALAPAAASEPARVRGLLRCLIRCPSAPAVALAAEEEALLGALASVAAAAVTVLDSAAASKGLGELYERAAAALALAQSNVLKSRERTERLQGLCACALLAALPLWWEPATAHQQVARVAEAALQGCRALFGSRRAALLLASASEGGAQHQHRLLDVFEAAEEGEGEEGGIRRAQMPWPRGGLLGRCLRKGQALNVPGPGGKEKGGLTQYYSAEVDGPDPTAPTLLLPLRGPGKAALGVLRVRANVSVGLSSIFPTWPLLTLPIFLLQTHTTAGPILHRALHVRGGDHGGSLRKPPGHGRLLRQGPRRHCSSGRCGRRCCCCHCWARGRGSGGGGGGGGGDSGVGAALGATDAEPPVDARAQRGPGQRALLHADGRGPAVVDAAAVDRGQLGAQHELLRAGGGGAPAAAATAAAEPAAGDQAAAARHPPEHAAGALGHAAGGNTRRRRRFDVAAQHQRPPDADAHARGGGCLPDAGHLPPQRGQRQRGGRHEPEPRRAGGPGGQGGRRQH